MKTGELVSAVRSELGGMNAELVSDAELIRYLDEAYKMFFRITGGITDIDSVVTEIDVIAGDYDAQLDTSILRVLKAIRRSDGVEIKVIGYADIVDDEGVFSLLRETGQVKYLVMGIKPHYARLAPIPSEDDVIDLIVERLPIRTLSTLTESPTELDEMHHWALLDWVKARIHQRPGATFFSPQLAATFESKFREYCERSRGEKERFKSKVRTVAYGGV